MSRRNPRPDEVVSVARATAALLVADGPEERWASTISAISAVNSPERWDPTPPLQSTLVQRFTGVFDMQLPGITGVTRPKLGTVVEIWAHPQWPNWTYETRYFITGNDGAPRLTRFFKGWPEWISGTGDMGTGPPESLALPVVRGGRAIEDDFEPEPTSTPIGPETVAEVVAVRPGEQATPTGPWWLQFLPPMAQLNVLRGFREVLLTTKQIEIKGQAITVETVRNTAALLRVELSRFGGTVAFAQRDVIAELYRLIQELRE